MRKTLLLAALAACAAWPARAATDIRLWHAMSGEQRSEFERLAARFNASQSEWRVVLVRQASHDQTLGTALAALEPPHIVQMDESGAADLLSRKGVVRPLWQVMAEAGVPLAADKYVPGVAGAFGDAQGRLLALPLNASTPVLYFNREAFLRARLDPSAAPRTWYEMAGTLGALIEAGQACGLTTSRPAWTMLENMSAWHAEPYATRDNGMAGGNVQLSFNGQLMVRWVAMLASWQKSGYFTYTGREHEAEMRFASGECAVLVSDSSSYEALRVRAAFGVVVAPLPYFDDFRAAPQNTLAGGAGLWVMAGRPRAEYAGVARFFAFLSRTDVQAEWHQRAGYLPLTQAAYELSRAQGYYAAHPGQEVAVRQLLLKSPTRDTRGIRLGALSRIRDIVNEELEQVWSGRKTTLDALNAAVTRGNALLRSGATR
ncbi:MAG TPA: sn-glycerol-3-phosphate ABC transporter substrate-binding protein UgpB [Burkholderiales bacterium]